MVPVVCTDMVPGVVCDVGVDGVMVWYVVCDGMVCANDPCMTPVMVCSSTP